MPSVARYGTLLVIPVPIGGPIMYRLRGLKQWSQLTDGKNMDWGEKALRWSHQFPWGDPLCTIPRGWSSGARCCKLKLGTLRDQSVEQPS